MSDNGCPNCGNTSAYRDFMRVQGVWACWYICRGCGHRFDGITASDDGVLPAGVVARGNELEVFPRPSLATMEVKNE